MMKRILCITVAVLVGGGWLVCLSADARDVPEIYRSNKFKKVGLAAFTFLKVTQGARVAGMGDAFSAVADDINAMFYNPAGLGHIEGLAYEFSYTRWLVDTAFYSGAVAYNTPRGVVGFSFVRYDVGDMLVRTVYTPQGTGEKIQSGSSAVGVAYAVKPTDKLGLGIRVAYVQETLHNDKPSSLVLDMGTHFYTGFRSARIAMSMRNFGPDTKVLAEDQKFLMPMNFNIGGAMEVYGKKGNPVSLTLAFDSAFPVDYAQRWHVGAEMWLANVIALRGGYKFNYDAEDYSLGVGLKGAFGKRTVTADVSYTHFGSLFDAPIRVTIGGSF